MHRDTNLNGQPLAINGKPYPKGLWTHAFNDQTPADIVFDIAGRNYSIVQGDRRAGRPGRTGQRAIPGPGGRGEEGRESADAAKEGA